MTAIWLLTVAPRWEFLEKHAVMLPDALMPFMLRAVRYKETGCGNNDFDRRSNWLEGVSLRPTTAGALHGWAWNIAPAQRQVETFLCAIQLVRHIRMR